MSLAYVFPGQGSQAPGMGQELFEQFPAEVAQADEILGYSLAELCLEEPANRLHHTQFTQPALFAVNALSYLAKLAGGGPRPDYAAGHSLGEYDALFAAGAFDFATGLRLVQKRGEIMGRAEGGAMTVVVGLTPERVQQLLAAAGLDDVDLANYNSPQQVVLSGPEQRMAGLTEVLAEAKMVMPLKVSGAFHSRYMREAAAEFGEFLRGFQFAPLQFPVIANVDAQPYADDKIAENLTRQIDHSVQWVETIHTLRRLAPGLHLEELGPGRVLTGLIRRIK